VSAKFKFRKNNLFRDKERILLYNTLS